MKTVALPVLLFLSVVLLSSCAPRYTSLLEEGGIPYIIIEKASILDLQSEELNEEYIRGKCVKCE